MTIFNVKNENARKLDGKPNLFFGKRHLQIQKYDTELK